eukprot:TRINITY_DN590_c0_g3_i1.p1 TRINITY_DN590_c0_g3~~TRINITY_DN590_c0_g3_i1.p1  ORF type:complete len:511 (-),score=202.08 TRINITY_DN590_c0_g3_i1:92-1624(-)
MALLTNYEAWELAKIGAELLWNFRFEDSKQYLQQQLQQFNDLSFSWFLAQNTFARAVLTEEKEDVKIAFESMENAMKQARIIRDASVPKQDLQIYHSNVMTAKLCLAELSMLDAALKFRLQQLLKGVYNFRKSWKYYESAQAYFSKVATTDPKYQDLQSILLAGVGFFHFVVSIVPKKFLWLVEGVGFQGNRTLGFSELTSSAELNRFGSRIALLHLCWIKSFFEESFTEGERYLEQILNTFPTAAHIQYLGCYVYRKQGKMQEAERVIQLAYENGVQIPQFQLYMKYEMGYNAYLNANWNDAIRHLQEFLDNSTIPAFRVYASFQLAMSYEMCFHKERAIDILKKCFSFVRKGYDYDEYSERRGKRYIAKNGLTMFERKFLVACLHFEVRRYDETLDELNNCEPISETIDDRMQLSYLRAAALQQKSQFESAKELYQQVLLCEKLIAKEFLYIIPHSMTGLAEILIKENKPNEAKVLLRNAKNNYSNYDFDQLLTWRIKRNLDSINEVD